MSFWRKGAQGLGRILLAGTMLFSFVCCRIYADFEETGFGARTAGMANSFVGLADDVYAIVYNPGALGHLKKGEFTASYQKLYWGLSDLSELGESFIAFAYPIRSVPDWLSSRIPRVHDWGTVGVALWNFNAGSLYGENTFIVSYGKTLHDLTGYDIYTGMAVKILSKKYASTVYTENAIDFLGNSYGLDPVFEKGYGKTAVGIDLGAYYPVNKEYTLGLTIKNINAPDTGLRSMSILPLDIRAGLCYRDDDNNILLDGNYKGGDVSIGPAIEKWLWEKQFALRGGVQLGSRELANLTLGSSYKYKDMFRFDYSFGLPLRGIQGTNGSHTISLVVFFEQGAGTDSTEGEMPASYRDALRSYYNKEYVRASEKFQSVAGNNATPEKYVRASGDYIKKIRASMEKITARSTSEKEKAYARGLLTYREGKYHESLAAWQEYLKAEPKNKEIKEYVNLINARIEEEKRNKINGYFAEAKGYYANREYSNALSRLQNVLALDPNHPEAGALLSEAKVKIEEERKAKAKELYTNGLMYFTDKKYKEAITEWQKSLRLDPSLQDAVDYIQRAKAELDKEKPGEVQAPGVAGNTAVPQGQAIDEPKAEEYYNSALIKYNKGLLPEAVADLKEALRFNPNHTGVSEALGRINSELEQQRNAVNQGAISTSTSTSTSVPVSSAPASVPPAIP